VLLISNIAMVRWGEGQAMAVDKPRFGSRVAWLVVRTERAQQWSGPTRLESFSSWFGSGNRPAACVRFGVSVAGWH